MIHLKSGKNENIKTQLWVVPLYEDMPSSVICADHLTCQAPEWWKRGYKDIVYTYENDNTVIWVGLGKKESGPNCTVPARSMIHNFKMSHHTTMCIGLSHLDTHEAEDFLIGILLGQHNIGYYKTQKTEKPLPEIYVHDLLNIDYLYVRHYAETAIEMMTLVDTPSNIKTPQYIAHLATNLAKRHGLNIVIKDKAELESEGFGCLIGVGQGSVHPPLLIVLEYSPENINDKCTYGLVGKGVTFDTGGISIKPSANMGYMKSDMGGAAAIFGAILMAAKMKLNKKIIAVLPLAENAVDALSIRPGDVLNSYSGHSVEIIDTDAEGRLILADAISYLIKTYQPDVIVDAATLTGNCIMALGYHAAGLFTKNDQLAASLIESGVHTYERIWRLPMWDDYATEMHSDIADIKNLATRPVGGAITAAKFLEFFTAEHPTWAHLDIAGVAFSDSEYTKMRSSTAFGVKLLYRFLSQGFKVN